jgi:membrane protease YdiL (CAAX protease family)
VAVDKGFTVTDPFSNQPEVDPLNRTQVLAAMGITALVLLLVTRLLLLFDTVYILNLKFTMVAVLVGIGLGLAITAASAIIYLLWSVYRRSADFYLELVLKPLIWFDLIWLGFLPGLSEELLFRGVLLPALGWNWFALIVSSLCFGVLHFSGQQYWAYVVWATFIGLVLGCSALVTGNLLVPVVAHITTNLISSFVWKLRTSA